MKILLIGRNGQVGFELEKSLAALGSVGTTDRAMLDLKDPDAIKRVVRETRPELIVNAAAYTAVDQAESEDRLAMQINGVAPGVLAEEAKRCSALLVHFSTDYVFDGTKSSPYVEGDSPNPVNVYGKTKLEGERRVAGSGCRHLMLRTSWVYGPRGKNFLLTILKAARAGKELKVVNDQTGAPTSSVAIARATADCLKAGAEGLCHVSAAGQTTWHGFAEAIVKQAGLKVPILPIRSDDYPARARRPRNSVLDNSKLKGQFDVRLAPWDEGMKEILARILAHA